MCYEVAEALWGSSASRGRLSIGLLALGTIKERRLATAAQDAILPHSSISYAGFDDFSVAAFTECPLKVRVGENSPSL